MTPIRNSIGCRRSSFASSFHRCRKWRCVSRATCCSAWRRAKMGLFAISSSGRPMCPRTPLGRRSATKNASSGKCSRTSSPKGATGSPGSSPRRLARNSSEEVGARPMGVARTESTCRRAQSHASLRAAATVRSHTSVLLFILAGGMEVRVSGRAVRQSRVDQLSGPWVEPEGSQAQRDLAGVASRRVVSINDLQSNK